MKTGLPRDPNGSGIPDVPEESVPRLQPIPYNTQAGCPEEHAGGTYTEQTEASSTPEATQRSPFGKLTSGR